MEQFDQVVVIRKLNDMTNRNVMAIAAVADRIHTQDDPYVVKIDIDDHGPVNMVHTADWNYFNVLTEKLGWIKE